MVLSHALSSPGLSGRTHAHMRYKCRALAYEYKLVCTQLNACSVLMHAESIICASVFSQDRRERPELAPCSYPDPEVAARIRMSIGRSVIPRDGEHWWCCGSWGEKVLTYTTYSPSESLGGVEGGRW